MIIEIGYSATDEEPQHEGYYKSIENAKKALDNLEKTLNPLTIKPLTENDRPAVQALDELSNDYVEQWLEDNEDYAWGAFLDGKLIGYCTTGYADNCGDAIEKHPKHGCDSILLSDVFILPEYRRKKYATMMIKEALDLRHQCDGNPNENVFLTVLYDGLAALYEPLGFTFIDNNEHMIQNI